MSIDQGINEAFELVSTNVQKVILWGLKLRGMTFPLVVMWLALGALFLPFIWASRTSVTLVML